MKNTRLFFFGRVKQLASITNLDGMWADVPIYSDTVTNFAPGDKNSQELFVAWSKAKSLNGGSGFYRFPTTQEIKLPIFSAYLAWRHETLSDFQDNIRLAGEAGKSSFITASEVYSLDYMDGYWVGLDGGYRKSNKQLRVWEVDSVSNTQAMKYASIQDFRNKISMNKYAVASDNGQASWIFAYGNEPSDANLVMASILAVGANPFECKTPQMTETVGDEFRKKWFEFIDEHESLIYYMNRIATVGVYYSSSTRDYLDGSKNGNCFYGMFQDTTAIPNDDADWWSNDSSGNTLLNCKHLSLYRGSMGILNRLHIPHTLVIDNALGMQNKNVLKNLKVVILPNVVSMSQKSYNEIKNFMLDGGILIIVGSQIPATLDEYGVAYEKSLFQIDNYLPESIGNSKKFVKVIGEGALIFRSDINSYNVQSNNIGIMDFFETTFRTHVQEKAIINIDESSNLQSKENIYVEYGERNEFGLETIYIVNLNGVQQPIISSVTSRINIDYKAPRGKRVEKIRVYSADEYGWTGQLGFKEFSTQSSSGYWIRLDSFIINQFCIVAISLIDEDKTSASSVSAYDFPSTEWESVMNNGIAFIKNKMRDERFGIYTNYKDIPQIDDIYAVGHHVTAEHMGLFLRSSVCLNDEQGFLEGYNFVKKYMRSRLKNVVNWAVDKNTGLPFLQSFTEGEFINANAPLDDLRVIRGLIEGYEKFQITGSMSLANQLLRGLYWNGVTNIKQVASYSIGNYGNVMGYAYDWNSATGEGVLGIEPIPIDYSYLFVINQAVAYNPRWLKVLTDSTQMMLDSEIDFSPGLFYNGIDVQGEYTGDFEYRDLLTSNRGKHLKTIQTLWIALHLAEVGTDSNSYISESLKERALQASKRALDRYKAFYLLNNRVPEYMTYFGEDVSISGPDGLSFDENLINGEARIYAQIARIALILDDRSFSIQVISEKIISDSQTDVTSPLFGNIGLSTSSSEDAEAFNVLESTLTICLASQK